jgi:hypothetical protein
MLIWEIKQAACHLNDIRRDGPMKKSQLGPALPHDGKSGRHLLLSKALFKIGNCHGMN